MLITTSRKPSPRTRSFAGSLERVFNSKYINRGKMSMRDVLLKLRASDHTKVAVISEMKGNPSRIEFFNLEGDSILIMDITVSNPMGSGRVKKKSYGSDGNWTSQISEGLDQLPERIAQLLKRRLSTS